MNDQQSSRIFVSSLESAINENRFAFASFHCYRIVRYLSYCQRAKTINQLPVLLIVKY